MNDQVPPPSKTVDEASDQPRMIRRHRTTTRVRYAETDAQGHVHHSIYFQYFEIGRGELLRACGVTYREFEAGGLMLVLVDASARFFDRAFYDDVLTIETETVRSRGVRIEHRYRILRDESPIAEGTTVLACVDPQGKPKKLPPWLQLDPRREASSGERTVAASSETGDAS